MASLLAVGFLDVPELLSKGGVLLLFAIIFAESGLLVGFFLPGDSLLFTAGAVAGGAFTGASGALEPLREVHFNIWVICIGCAAMAVLGDQVGYMIGSKAGPKLFDRPDSRLFKRKYVDSAEMFFSENGPKALVLARFVPVVRTFVPTVAGVSKMDYSTFLRWNVIGGVLWGGFIPMLGYFFGSIPWVRDNFEVAVLGIVFISFLPMLFEFRHAIVSTGQRLLGRKATDTNLASGEVASPESQDPETKAR